MGKMNITGNPINMQLPDNKNSAIQFTYKLKTEIKKELFEYLTNTD